MQDTKGLRHTANPTAFAEKQSGRLWMVKLGFPLAELGNLLLQRLQPPLQEPGSSALDSPFFAKSRTSLLADCCAALTESSEELIEARFFLSASAA